MKKEFVISHIHGQLRSLERLLGGWDHQNETLIVLGDVNDYGPNSFLVYKRLLQIKELFGDKVVFLKGNHEILFEKFYANPSIYAEEYFDNGGIATLASFYNDGLSFEQMNSREYLVNEVFPKTDFTELLLYLSKCSSYYETDKSIFLSKETRTLKNKMMENWEKTTSKNIFFSLKTDDEFKIDYFSKLAKESLAFKMYCEEIPYVMIQEQKRFDMKSTAIEHVSNLGNKTLFVPKITGTKIVDGEVKKEIIVSIEE